MIHERTEHALIGRVGESDGQCWSWSRRFRGVWPRLIGERIIHAKIVDGPGDQVEPVTANVRVVDTEELEVSAIEIEGIGRIVEIGPAEIGKYAVQAIDVQSFYPRCASPGWPAKVPQRVLELRCKVVI